MSATATPISSATIWARLVSRYIAEDALADIAVEYHPLPAVTDLDRALAPDAARVHDDVAGNVAARVHQRKGDYDAARQAAALVLRRRFRYDRGCSAPIETRGVVADWDARAERLTVWDTTQAPVVVRNGLAAMLKLSERVKCGWWLRSSAAASAPRS